MITGPLGHPERYDTGPHSMSASRVRDRSLFESEGTRFSQSRPSSRGPTHCGSGAADHCSCSKCSSAQSPAAIGHHRALPARPTSLSHFRSFLARTFWRTPQLNIWKRPKRDSRRSSCSPLNLAGDTGMEFARRAAMRGVSSQRDGTGAP